MSDQAFHNRTGSGHGNPYRERMRAADAATAAALARVSARPATESPAANRGRTIIEHRTGAGVTRRVYGESPLRRPVMG